MRRRLAGPKPARTGSALTKHYRLPSIKQDTALEMTFHGPREYLGFSITTTDPAGPDHALPLAKLGSGGSTTDVSRSQPSFSSLMCSSTTVSALASRSGSA